MCAEPQGGEHLGPQHVIRIELLSRRRIYEILIYKQCSYVLITSSLSPFASSTRTGMDWGACEMFQPTIRLPLSSPASTELLDLVIPVGLTALETETLLAATGLVGGGGGMVEAGVITLDSPDWRAPRLGMGVKLFDA